MTYCMFCLQIKTTIVFWFYSSFLSEEEATTPWAFPVILPVPVAADVTIPN